MKRWCITFLTFKLIKGLRFFKFCINCIHLIIVYVRRYMHMSIKNALIYTGIDMIY